MGKLCLKQIKTDSINNTIWYLKQIKTESINNTIWYLNRLRLSQSIIQYGIADRPSYVGGKGIWMGYNMYMYKLLHFH